MISMAKREISLRKQAIKTGFRKKSEACFYPVKQNRDNTLESISFPIHAGKYILTVRGIGSRRKALPVYLSCIKGLLKAAFPPYFVRPANIPQPYDAIQSFTRQKTAVP